MEKGEISNSVIKRLPRYYRFLGELIKQGFTKMSSRELAQRMGLTASQIRQDLNCFGGFGQQGYGYNLKELRRQIGLILGADKGSKTILIGAGNLGRALASHMDFSSKGYNLIGIFDVDKNVIGNEIGDLTVKSDNEIEEFCKENEPVVAILCIPKSSAQEVADKLVSLGIKAFWNFSHYDLLIEHKDAIVENVHLGDSLLTLSYHINHKLK